MLILAYVKEQLGHSSIKMTVDVYWTPCSWSKPASCAPSSITPRNDIPSSGGSRQQKKLPLIRTLRLLISCKLVELMGIEPTTS